MSTSTAPTALLLIDWINDLAFPEGDALLPRALAAAESTASLKKRAKANGVPAIYANDNFGRWQSDFRAQVEHCIQDHSKGRRLAEILLPDADDYFILKPMHSAFFATPLDLLLSHLGVRRLILTGLTTELCVNFTANDAYMRGLELSIPCDCVASASDAAHWRAMEAMHAVMKMDVTCAVSLMFQTSDDESERFADPGAPPALGPHVMRTGSANMVG